MNGNSFPIKDMRSGKGGGWGRGGEMTQALYSHINNKIIQINK
jgi:hypothetical protein